ncbi:hypothetical protein TNCV_1445441 [Trichonephila clavipes]|nr:hypothetical protein TNCV_1445441 [Trichonephila clavipes]
MAPHTITPAVRVVCRCKVKAGLRRSSRSLLTQTRLSSTADLVFKNGVMAFLPQLFSCKRFSTPKHSLVNCFIFHGERR